MVFDAAVAFIIRIKLSNDETSISSSFVWAQFPRGTGDHHENVCLQMSLSNFRSTSILAIFDHHAPKNMSILDFAFLMSSPGNPSCFCDPSKDEFHTSQERIEAEVQTRAKKWQMMHHQPIDATVGGRRKCALLACLLSLSDAPVL